MNKKRLSKIFAVALALVLCFSMAMPAFAATGTDYEGMTGAADTFKFPFDKYLVMDANANVPTVEFGFTIAPVAGAAAGSGTVAILPGKMTPTVGTASFSSSTRANTTLQAGDEVASFNPATQKYAKQEVTVDFTNVEFDEPGIYRYVIRENAGSVKGIITDPNPRYLDVYVEDASTSDTKLLKIAGYVLHTVENASVAAGDGMGAALNQTYVKSKGFTNQYITHDLKFSKAVAGNQASRDKYFAFTVKIEGALPNTTYNVNITDADATSGNNSATIANNAGKTNVSAITTNDSGDSEEIIFYLQHGQSITIEGLTDGAVWTITENAEDYKASVSVAGKDAAASNSATSDDAATEEVKEGITADTTVAFTNTRDGVVPTGVLLAVAPFAVLMLVGIAGFAAVLLKKKRSAK